MRVELDIDDELARRALHLTKETSVADAIRYALQEYVTAKTVEGFQEMAGKIDFDPEYLAQREREHPTAHGSSHPGD